MTTNEIQINFKIEAKKTLMTSLENSNNWSPIRAKGAECHSNAHSSASDKSAAYKHALSHQLSTRAALHCLENYYNFKCEKLFHGAFISFAKHFTYTVCLFPWFWLLCVRVCLSLAVSQSMRCCNTFRKICHSKKRSIICLNRLDIWKLKHVWVGNIRIKLTLCLLSSEHRLCSVEIVNWIQLQLLLRFFTTSSRSLFSKRFVNDKMCCTKNRKTWNEEIGVQKRERGSERLWWKR